MAAWTLEALKNEYDLTVLAFQRTDFAAIDDFYGTSLRGSDIACVYPNGLIQAALRLDFSEGSIQPAAYLMRMCRRLRHPYDLVMAAGMEEMDLGGPGLLYVHYPHLARFWDKYRDSGAGLAGLLRRQTRPWMLLAGYSVERLKQNVILTNSDWTAGRIRRAYGLPARTIYPPVTASVRQLPWASREDGFVCVGRLHARKRMDWVIAMLAQVRARHRAIRLHLVGTRDEGRAAGEYYRALRKAVAANGAWVQLHEDFSRQELLDLMGRSRYAIHALIDEHFGIAPAEALLAGCIPFVHDSGGQVEIVGGDARLCYRDDVAAEKIGTVLDSVELQLSLLESLEPRRGLFTVNRFMEEIRDAVSSAIR